MLLAHRKNILLLATAVVIQLGAVVVLAVVVRSLFQFKVKPNGKFQQVVCKIKTCLRYAMLCYYSAVFVLIFAKIDRVYQLLHFCIKDARFMLLNYTFNVAEIVCERL